MYVYMYNISLYICIYIYLIVAGVTVLYKLNLGQ